MGGREEDGEGFFEGGEAGADGACVGFDDRPDCGRDDGPGRICAVGRGGEGGGADDSCCTDAGDRLGQVSYVPVRGGRYKGNSADLQNSDGKDAYERYLLAVVKLELEKFVNR